jgi:hypothetical protein
MHGKAGENTGNRAAVKQERIGAKSSHLRTDSQ